MPIEIKELQIKAAVGNNPGNQTPTNPNPPDLEQLRQEIVREVTEEVLRMIQLKLER
ncbi:DUF5908 family protein [Cognataquiflexum aquatile]|jgi:hypothetical protein|uniref:DUF5908 family protein n=1 Tax=Cognataquiflexum aquatile TaxID=2249427 RepID=UPI001300955C|nr:DUF5908 family protein [Cognataquiflexum aquatile]